MKDDFRAAE